MAHEIQIEITANGSKAISAAKAVQAEMKKTKAQKVEGDPFQEVEKGAKAAAKDVDALGSTLSKVKSMIAGAFAVGSIYAFGKAAMSAAANTELLHKGLAFVLDSDSEASRLVKNIQDIGEASAYDTTQLLPLARAWVNIGDNVDTATSKMQKIVDLGSAYGLTADNVGAVNLALTQMQMAGKIGQQDMMQLINAGIPAWQILSEKMGIPVEELKDMSSKSELTQDAMEQLWDGITEKTEGAATSMADTLMGKFSNAQEAIQNSMSAVGDIISQAFNVPGILDEAGEMAEGIKASITSIRDNAKEVGLKDAIIQELQQISPAAAVIADGCIQAFNNLLGTAKDFAASCEPLLSSVKDTFNDVGDAIGDNKEVVELLVEAILTIGTTVAVIKGVETAFVACKAAAMAFSAACTANPVLLAISAIIAIIVLMYNHWDEIKACVQSVYESISSSMAEAKAAIMNAFDGAITYVKGKWEDLKSFLSHPIDTVVNVIRRDSGDSTAVPSASGGVFGMATGGVVGGLVPLANGGQLKHGTPAIVGEAGPEAVIPLKESVLGSIGRAIANSYQKGANRTGSQAEEISMSIKSQVNTGPVSEYARILEKAQKKAEAVGASIAKYTDLQQKANEEVEKYADDGEKANEYQQKLAEITAQINKLQASGTNPDKVGALEMKRDNLTANYEKEKSEAIKNAQELAAARESIETEAANAISSIRINALEKVNDRETAIKEAQRQLDSANQATSLSEYMAAMEAKDEITGESYATTLANEEALNAMRQVWHEQMMLNSVEWGTYMQETLTQAEQQLINGVAQGLSQCMVYGKNFADIMNNLAGNVLSTILQAALKKAITSLVTMIGLGKKKHQDEIKNAQEEATAQASKTGIIAANATGAYIVAHPYDAWSAALTVSGAMTSAQAAMSSVKLADGGFVTGPGTSTSDSIPAMLSNGEYVINADAVRRLGTSYLNTLNSPHYATGGQVGEAVVASTPTGGNITLNVSAMDASSFMDFLRNGGMDSIKQMLFDGNRDFTTEAGVW